MALTGFMVNVPNWNTPPSDPFPIPPDFVINNINNLSSKFGQNGGVPGLKNLNTAGLPPGPWLPPNLGESDALQILIESTKLATQPNPPPQPPPEIGSNIRGR